MSRDFSVSNSIYLLLLRKTVDARSSHPIFLQKLDSRGVNELAHKFFKDSLQEASARKNTFTIEQILIRGHGMASFACLLFRLSKTLLSSQMSYLPIEKVCFLLEEQNLFESLSKVFDSK